MKDLQFGQEAADILGAGGIGIIPTDTLYGIVTTALDSQAVEKVYAAKDRDRAKPVIVLIADIEDLDRFDIDIPTEYQAVLPHYWPGPNSILFPCDNSQWEHLHRGSGHIAFRVPAWEGLREFLRLTGPLVAPSANPESETPAKTIEKAKQYFDNKVDLYIDGGLLDNPPSALLKIDANGVERLR